jgi:hypothetical protein
MPFDVLNPWMLLGLAGLAIPIIIHLLNRRRFDVVDWGAMQFLRISEITRRKLMLEEVLLMMLRMGLIGLLVFGLAGPFIDSSALARLAPKVNRDVVLVFDGSYSMGYQGSGKSVNDAAKEWALDFVKNLSAGDSVAVLQAKQQVVPVVGDLSLDLQRVRQHIETLAPPAGGCAHRARHHPAGRRPALQLVRRRQPDPLGAAGARAGLEPQGGRRPGPAAAVGGQRRAEPAGRPAELGLDAAAQQSAHRSR